MRTTPSAFPWPHGAFGRIARYPDFFMARDQIDMTQLQSRDELVTWFEAGCKPPSEFRIGTEHEKTPFTLEGRQPVPYEGARGIGALLEGMQLLLGWEPIMERGNIIGLYDVTGGGAISPLPEGRASGNLSFRPRSGATRITRAPACCRGCSRTAWGSSAGSITRSTYPCTSSSAARPIWMSQAPRSAPSSRAATTCFP